MICILCLFVISIPSIPTVPASSLTVHLREVARLISTGDITGAAHRVLNITDNYPPRDRQEVDEMFHFTQNEMSHSISRLIKTNPEIAIQYSKDINEVAGVLLLDVCQRDWKHEAEPRMLHLNEFEKVLRRIERSAVYTTESDGYSLMWRESERDLIAWTQKKIRWVSKQKRYIMSLPPDPPELEDIRDNEDIRRKYSIKYADDGE